MNTSVAHKPEAFTIVKRNPALPAFVLLAPAQLAVRAGVSLGAVTFAEDTPLVRMAGLTAGRDYEIVIDERGDVASIFYGEAHPNETVVGGFHFAPGSNAPAREGGDSEPAINPCSIYDLNFRPACLDPRGMAYVVGSPGAPLLPGFWSDIYLTARDHLAGTSRHGAAIADGYRSLPDKLDGNGTFEKLDYATAQAILAHHGKALLSLDEFFAAAYGVTERQAADSKAANTGLDAPRTSRFGLMQAAGQRYVWGHDGDPDTPRAPLFGGSWGSGEFAGSRFAFVVYWPGYSNEWVGARGRSDHLQLD